MALKSHVTSPHIQTPMHITIPASRFLHATFLARYATLFARYATLFARYDTLLARNVTLLTFFLHAYTLLTRFGLNLKSLGNDQNPK
jgi:hypothetical protein